ncbi:BTB/POZ protein [Glomus cerebriforme]|uniref:BTB/POZ protein n=1 Tax=Glomus cerebriforme TaxID=658196 RepID=A0A397S9F1_9GLOM|nr:BTB/POZ protein [Glomus cerebriforme]
MSSELLRLTSKEYGDILKSGEFSDTEILVGEEPDTKVFLAHSLILKIRSPYFRTAFSSRWVRTENNIIKLQKPNISVKVFDILIKYIYSSIIDLTKYDIKTNVAVLIAADELCLYDLCSYIEKELLRNETLLKNNFILIHNVANKFNQFTKLLQFYRVNFQKDPNLILRTNDFTTIQQETLLNFLTEHSQSLRPIEIWDKLIEWAIARSHELPSDVIRWTSSEITTFRGIIQSFIPHINFKEISPADFSHKIKPLKDIFDDKSYAKILEHYSFNNEVRSNFKMNIDSRIISSDLAFLIGNLIKITRQDGNKLCIQ